MNHRLPFSLVATVIGVTIAVVAWLAVPHYFAAVPPRHTWGDGALLELYTHYVHEGVWELGPYSRYGWYHPGPLLFRLLWPLYEHAGLHPFALNGGALLINLGSVALSLWLALRHGRTGTVMALGLGLLVLTLRSGDTVLSFWNPHIVILPMVAFLLSTAAAAQGDVRAWLPFVLTGSLLAQTHVSVVPVVAVCGAYGLARHWRTWFLPHPHAPAERYPVAWLCAAGLLLALLWWPPAHEALSSDGGNLAALWRFFAEARAGQPWALSLAVWVDRLTAILHPGPQVVGGVVMAVPLQATELFPLLPWLLAAPVYSGVMIWVSVQAGRGGDRFTARLAQVVLIGSLVALTSITRIPGVVEEYQVSWIAGVGMIGLALAVGTAAEALGSSRWLPSRAGAAMAVAVLLASLAVGGLRFRDYTRIVTDQTALRVADVSSQVLARLSEEGRRQVWVRVSPVVWPEAAGVIMRLRKDGVRVQIPDGPLALLFGTPLVGVRTDGWPVLHLVDAEGGRALEQRSAEVGLPGAERLRAFLDVPPDPLRR